MLRRTSGRILAIVLLVFISLGCSGNRTEPLTTPEDQSNVSPAGKPSSQHQLLGIWTIRVDMESLEAEVIAVRRAYYHFNVTDLLSPPECYHCIQVTVNSFNTETRVMDLWATIVSPVELDVYDVRGIVYTNDLGHILLNPDDWTNLWDIPGGEVINPFKTFNAKEENRIFPGESYDWIKYFLYIPEPPQYAEIEFAVDVSFPGNCWEPYEMNIPESLILYYHQDSQTFLEAEVLDWQSDVNEVSLYCPEVIGPEYVPFSHIEESRWGIEVENNLTPPTGDYGAIVRASSAYPEGIYLFDTVIIHVSRGWANTWGAGGFDTVIDVVLDSQNNIYTIGTFEKTTDLNPGHEIDEHISHGSSDCYLSKFNRFGEYQWGRAWGSYDQDFIFGIDVDDSGNIYVTGNFKHTADFDPGPGIDEHTVNYEVNAFVSKYDIDGNYKWTRTWGGEFWDKGYAVAIDDLGNVYVTGQFSGEVDFDPGPDTDIQGQGLLTGAFLSKFDPSGEYIWARTWFGGPWWDYGEDARSVSIDSAGDVYVVGSFDYTVDFDPGPDEDKHKSSGNRDGFLSKFNADGEYQWVRTWGDEGAQYGYDACIDSLDNIYITGAFAGTADFDPGPGVDVHTTDDYLDIFLTKFAPGGDFIWAETWDEYYKDRGYTVAVDNEDNVYVGGGSVEPGDNGDSFATFYKLNPAGELTWSQTWFGDGYNCCDGVAVNTWGHIYLGGRFYSTIDFDPGDGVNEHTAVKSDAFLLKFPPDGVW